MFWIYFAVGAGFAALVYIGIIWRRVAASITASKPLIAQATRYEQHPHSASMHMLVAGDSLAVGVGATDNHFSLAGRIGRDYPQAAITNIAKSGSKFADLEAQLAPQTRAHYDLIFITIGANDITGRTPYADVEASLRRMLSQTDILGSKTILLTAGDVGLSPAFLWPLSTYFGARTRAVRKIFMSEIAQHAQAHYVDLFRKKKDEIFNTNIPRYYAADRFHPSADGYAVWYALLKPLL